MFTVLLFFRWICRRESDLPVLLLRHLDSSPEYKIFISLVWFIPRYFILFDAAIIWIFFLISFSDSPLWVYRNILDYCIFILYPATLLNLFFVAFLGFSIYSMSCANNGSFMYSFPVGIHFIYLLFSLISMTRISNAMLTYHVDSRHPCIVSDLRRNAFSFCYWVCSWL